MVGDEQIRQVQSLLDEGRTSHDDIAVRVGAPRYVVTEVALGLLTPVLIQQQPSEEEDRPASMRIRARDAVVSSRCPKCGATVIMPCRECEVLAMLERHRGRIIDD